VQKLPENHGTQTLQLEPKICSLLWGLHKTSETLNRSPFRPKIASEQQGDHTFFHLCQAVAGAPLSEWSQVCDFFLGADFGSWRSDSCYEFRTRSEVAEETSLSLELMNFWAEISL